jgi:hypothetical protein
VPRVGYSLPVKKPAIVADVRLLVEALLVLAYRRVVAAEHAKPVPLEALARELDMSEGLSEKIAGFLESEGLIDYDDQAVDVTIPGMVRAEAILRGEPVARPTADPASSRVARRKAR